MKRLSAKKIRALKIVHIIGAMLWMGGITCMLVTLISATQQPSSDAVLSQLAIVEAFDYFVVIPGVSICIALGFIYGFFTPWGFASHKWVLLKWILFFVACLPAAVFFLPLLDGMKELVAHFGLEALKMTAFSSNYLILTVMIIAQLTLSVVMIGVSVYKPFKKKKETTQQNRSDKIKRSEKGMRRTDHKEASLGASEL
jgi:Na+/phosphate symporter